MKISKEERQLIKAFLNFKCSQWEVDELDETDTPGLEYDVMKITGNCNMEHRQAVEDFITELIEKGAKR